MGHVIHVMSPLRAAWIFLADQEVPKDKAAKPKVGAADKNHQSSFGDVMRGIFFVQNPNGCCLPDAVEFQVLHGFCRHVFIDGFFPNVSGIGYFLKSEIFVTYCQIELELDFFRGYLNVE